MMMKGVEVKCRVINWNNVKGERGKGEEREEFQNTININRNWLYRQLRKEYLKRRTKFKALMPFQFNYETDY